jgi:hypothetical protein
LREEKERQLKEEIEKKEREEKRIQQEQKEKLEREEREEKEREAKRLKDEKEKKQRELLEEKRKQDEKVRLEKEELLRQQQQEPKKDIDTREIRQEYQPQNTDENPLSTDKNDPASNNLNENFQPKMDEDERNSARPAENDNDDDAMDNDRGYQQRMLDDLNAQNNQNSNDRRNHQFDGPRNFPPSLQFNNERQRMQDTFDVPRCVISLANVPYRASTMDLLNYFKPFDVCDQHVMRRFNDRGQPTGDARVCFENPAETRRAYEMCRNKKIHNRKVFLDII